MTTASSPSSFSIGHSASWLAVMEEVRVVGGCVCCFVYNA